MQNYFNRDRLLRNAQGKPLARVVLASDYTEGEDIEVAVMTIARQLNLPVKGAIFYVDGQVYRVPKDLPDVKITYGRNQTKVSSFVLKKEG